MKISLRELRTLIREALEKKVADVYVDDYGRWITVDGKQYEVFEFASYQNPRLDDMLAGEEAESDEALRLVAKAEEDLLRAHRVTHVVDVESFEDREEHPVEDYIRLVKDGAP